MVGTRAQKRRAATDEPEAGGGAGMVEDSIGTNSNDAELALAQAAKVRSRKAKKKKLESWKKHHPPFEMLCLPEILEKILLYLDNAKDVYNLSMLNKSIRQSITPQIVVRSAVFAGGKTRDSIGDVMALLEDRSIHVPSTFRLLRLVNGKQCEKLEDCYAYDIIKKKPSSMAKISSRPLGLCICSHCVEADTAIHVRHSSNFAREHKRVPKDFHTWHNSRRLLSCPQMEASTNEPIGPFLIGKDVTQLHASSYKENSERTEALNKLLEDIDSKIPASHEKLAETMIDSYAKAESEYEAFEAAKLQVEIDKRNAKNAAKAAKKLQKARPVFESLSNLLQDYTHKEKALRCQWDDGGLCRFHFGPSRAILGPLLSAPSSATKKKINDAAREIREKYDLLKRTGFLSSTGFLSFLNDDNESSSDERDVSRTLRTQLTPERLLLRENYRVVDDREFLRLVSVESVTSSKDALLYLMQHTGHGNLLETAFVDRVVSNPNYTYVFRKNMKKLAKRMYRAALPRNFRKLESWDIYMVTFNGAKRQYRNLKRNVKDYLRQEATVRFLDEVGPPAGRPNQMFSRRHTVETMYYSTLGGVHLANRDFSELLQVHKHIFNNPNHYRYDITFEVRHLI